MSDLGEALVAKAEGRRSCVYPDSRGFQSVGIGCCIDPRVPGAGLCDEAISVQFDHDSAEARATAAKFPHYATLDPVRQAVLFSMAYQMGSKPLEWPDFENALQAQDYTRAAAAGRATNWWKVETRNRAEWEMRMLESGTWMDPWW